MYPQGPHDHRLSLGPWMTPSFYPGAMQPLPPNPWLIRDHRSYGVELVEPLAAVAPGVLLRNPAILPSTSRRQHHGNDLLWHASTPPRIGTVVRPCPERSGIRDRAERRVCLVMPASTTMRTGLIAGSGGPGTPPGLAGSRGQTVGRFSNRPANLLVILLAIQRCSPIEPFASEVQCDGMGFGLH